MIIQHKRENVDAFPRTAPKIRIAKKASSGYNKEADRCRPEMPARRPGRIEGVKTE